MNGWIAAATLALLVALAAWLNQDSADPYCDMVALWWIDAAAGVPHADRRGWPPYRGEGACK
jgi:hypothetical protein